jgi:RNA polymerase sigma factor (sigma-70 family)
MLAGACQEGRSRTDGREPGHARRVREAPRDGATGMSDAHVVDDDAPWWELEGYPRHAACLIAARAGDREALHALVVDLNPLIWHVARGQGLDHGVAEDVVQTVWLTLLRNLNAVAEPRALASWLIITTRREASRARGGTKARVEPILDDTLDQMPSEHGLPEEETLREDRDKWLWRAFNRLPRQCQELLRLTVLAGRAEYNHVARELKMARGSIGPNRGRCISKLRGYLDQEGGMS